MSKIKPQSPIIHTPKFTEYQIKGIALKRRILSLGFEVPMGLLDSEYFYTDMDGWLKLLDDLMFKSSLYKKNRFDCENYAIKAMTICAERYGLNTMMLVIGDIPQGRHGFNMFLVKSEKPPDELLLWEPNMGFDCSHSAFPIGEFGYKPDKVMF